MLRLSKLLAVFAVINIFSGPVFAAPSTSPIGSATTVKNQVVAAYGSDERDLKIGDRVHQDELIQVGTDSIGELVLDDDTMLALGPGSKLLLDKFVYNGERENGDIVLNLVQGAFRFVTGIASKKSYKIRTRSASITVRGTIFDVYAADDGKIWLLLLEGAVRACNDTGDCHKLNKPGHVIRVTGDGKIDEPMRWASLPDRDLIDFAAAFPFVINPPGIDPIPLLTQDEIIKSEPTPKKKKKASRKKKKQKKVTKKKRRKTIKKARKKHKKKVKQASSGSDGAGAAVALGVGLAIGAALLNKKKHHKNPGHGGGKGGGNSGGGHGGTYP